MNPLKWVRWKLLAVLALVVGAFYFLGLNPLARREVNDLGSGGLGARWLVEQLDVGLLAGDLDLAGLLLATPERDKSKKADKAEVAAEDRVLHADRLRFDLDMAQALRKRLHGEITITAPKLRIERRPDGSINIGEIGSEEPEKAPEAGKGPTDWVGAIETWFERLKKLEEWRRKRAAGRPGEEEAPAKTPEEIAREKEAGIQYKKRVTYPYNDVTRFVAQKLVGEGFEIQFADQSAGEGGAGIPPLQKGRIEILNLSEKPGSYPEPIRWQISGEIAGAPVSLTGGLDLRDLKEARDQGLPPRNELRFDFEGTGLPANLANIFAGDSLPFRFTRGKIDLTIKDFTILDLERLNIQPSFGFQEVAIEPRAGVKTIAGVEAGRFCQAFNEAGTFKIGDITVGGTLSRPEIHLGKAIPELLASGGKAFVQKQAGKAIEQGEKELEKVIEKNLGGSEELKKAAGTIKGEAGKAAGGILKGFLGGEKKEEKPKSP